MTLLIVQTTLLPFLLPQEKLKKSLYRPYDVPQDVCVSAPTGSGKTLAYVLPIIEVTSFVSLSQRNGNNASRFYLLESLLAFAL